MVDYATKHSKALRKVEEYGAPVSFDKTTQGAYDPETDEYEPPTTSSVAGHAVEIPGDPEEYAALELIPTEAITLFFVPTVLGELPELDSTVSWAGDVRTVSQIFPIRPAGDVIAARVIVT